MRSNLNILFVMLLGLILTASCGTTPSRTLNAYPNSPDSYFTVTVDSIPSDASVYEVDADDGSIRQLLGKTPLELPVGLGTRWWSDGTRCLELSDCYKLWGNAVTWSEPTTHAWDGNLVLNVALIKDGYYRSTVANKVVGQVNPNRYPPPNATVTVPLRPVADSSSNAPQQQQQQQQTVIIPEGGASSTLSRGTVMVTCSHENSEIYVDNAFVGNAPTKLKLSEGIHIIEVKKAGFKPYRKELRVLGSSELNLRVKLEKE